MVLGVARATARKAANAVTHHGGHNGPGQSVIHRIPGGSQIRHASSIPHPHPPSLGSCPPKPTRSPPHRLFSQSKNLFTWVFTQLSAPGVRVPTGISRGGAEAVRSLHSGATPTIRSGLSFHVRTALSSGTRSVFLPRPPSPGVKVATNVGLGIARNFSTARPIFQNLVENVPMVTRALYEADLDLRKDTTMKQLRRKRGTKSSKTKSKGKEMLKPADAGIRTMSTDSQENEQEFAQYFLDVIAPVTTYLYIPIAPTPSSRVPLPPDIIHSTDGPSLLPPLSYFGSYHASHQTHASRVASLFLRLDQANVWNRSVKCFAYGQGGDAAGVCTVLTVEFTGWTESEVRAVIGEAGTGWCGLEEVREDEDADLSELSSMVGHPEPEVEAKGSIFDPTASFIMPTLDFSSDHLDSISSFDHLDSISSSLVPSEVSSRAMSPVPDDMFATATQVDYSDPWSDVEVDIRGSTSDGSMVDPPSENGYYLDAGSETSWHSFGALEFSSQHLHRLSARE